MEKQIKYLIKQEIGNSNKLNKILNKINDSEKLTHEDISYIESCSKLLTENNIKLIGILYNKIFFRNPTKYDLEIWVTKMENDSLGPDQVEQLFLGSEEYKKMDGVREYYKKLQSGSGIPNINNLSVKDLDKISNISLYSNPRSKTGGAYHKFSIYLTKFLLKQHVSANAITVSAALIAILGSIFLSTTNFLLMLVGILLIEFHYLLDVVDGEVARFNLNPWPSGFYLDLIIHFIASPIIWAGFTVGFFRITDEPLILLIGLSLVVGTTVKLADYVLTYATIPLTIFWKHKLIKYHPDKPLEPLLSEKILVFMEKYFVLGQPGTFHVVGFCTAGLILGSFYQELFAVLLVFLGIYAILLNLSWILSVYIKIKNKNIERLFSP